MIFKFKRGKQTKKNTVDMEEKKELRFLTPTTSDVTEVDVTEKNEKKFA